MSDGSTGFSLFSGVSRIPHGVCLTWDPVLVWTLAASHLLVGLSYLAIPLALLVFMRRQRGLRFNWMFGLFGAFIFACGATHFISLMNIWKPDYALEAVVMAITAIVSVATAASLIPLIPVASNFLNDKARTEQQLQQMNLDLQDQMERFFDLAIAQRKSQAELQTVLDASPLGKFRTDSGGSITYINRSFEQLCGWPAESVMGAAWTAIIHPEDLPKFTRDWMAAVTGQSQFSSRHRQRRPDGSVLWVSMRAAPVQFDDTVAGYVGSLDDVTALHDAEIARKAEEERLRALTLTDSLTGLGNREGFGQALKSALDRRSRTVSPGGLAVLFADIDGLKVINDTYGHTTGDALIQGFSQRLKESLRVTDYCARLGGDEFTVVMESLRDLSDVGAICDKLLQTMQVPLVVDGRPLPLTASFGVACHLRATAIDPETLVKRADAMLYAAKVEGRNTYRIHPVEDEELGGGG